MEHDTVLISTLLCTRNPYTYSYFEISICIYSVRGENDQMSTNTFRYSTCCAANVYIFAYIFIWGPYITFKLIQFCHRILRLQYFITAYHSTTELSELSQSLDITHHDTVTIIRMKNCG